MLYGVGGSVTRQQRHQRDIHRFDEPGAIIIATKDGEQRGLVSG